MNESVANKRTVKFKLALVLTSILASLLFAELLLRWSWSNPYAGSRPDAMVRLWMQHADLDLRFDRTMIDADRPEVAFRTNARNYIEPAAQFEDPDFTVAFVGGSTTECKAVSEEMRFPALVSNLLEESGLRVNTLNAGVSGNTMHETLNIILNHVVLEEPDVVVLMHAVNDIGILRKNGSYASRTDHDVDSSTLVRMAMQGASGRSSLLGLARSVLTAPDLSPDDRPARTLELDPQPFRARLEIFVSICRALEIEPVLMTQPLGITTRNSMTPDWAEPMTQDSFNDVIRDVGEKTDTTVIDLAAAVLEHAQASPSELESIFYDGVHVTDHGSTLYARWISDELQEVLAPAEDQPFK